MKFMMITNKPDIAIYAHQCGVSRIFVDLEIRGKVERQGHLSTVISCHTIEDIKTIRAAVPQAELLVRVDPLHEHTADQVEQVIAAGADLLMLPMFHNKEQVAAFCEIVAGRKPVILLAETPGAMHTIADIVKVPGIDEIHIGLNDLYLGLELDFIFEPLANGMVENMCRIISAQKIPYGFGGVARLGGGDIPADLILAEHVRLGSTRVILSRAFHGNAVTAQELQQKLDLQQELERINQCISNLKLRSAEQMEYDRQQLVAKVARVVALKKQKEYN